MGISMTKLLMAGLALFDEVDEAATKRAMARAATLVMLTWVAATMAAVGTVFLFIALFYVLAPEIGVAGASASVGAIALLVGAVVWRFVFKDRG